MAFQNSKVTTAAKGNAKGGVKVGPTPAPVRKYVNPVLVERVEPVTYGGAKNLGPSSVEPGVTNTSPLADELKRVNALGDGGDHLQDVIEHGTARNASVDLGAPQTRDVSDEGLTPAYGMRIPNKKAGSYDTLPAKGTATSSVATMRKP
jgi:hypothetical protein